jgi:hypothetical protein
MMADFGVLSAIRDMLKMQMSTDEHGMADHIHISYPTKTSTYPMIILELEEVWTSLAMGKHSPRARLKLKARTLSNKLSGKESITIAEKLRGSIDGKTINLEDGKIVTLRLENSIVDIPTNLNKTRNVQQYFEAIVRG